MTATVMKRKFEKLKPRLVQNKAYKRVANNTFKEHLLTKLTMENTSTSGDGLE